MTQFSVGTLLRVTTGKGPRLVQITHSQRPYPPILRALKGDSPESETAQVFMADLPLNDPRIEHLGTVPVPTNAQGFPVFRLAVRDRAGTPIYWWYWDGEGLRLAPPQIDETLPLREIIGFDAMLSALERL